jgi:hypothetical protein
MKRLRALRRTLGPIGLIGLALLIGCAGFYAYAVRPVARELQVQKAAVEQARARDPFQSIASRESTQDYGRFYAAFPPLSALPKELEKLYGLANAAKIDLAQGEYRMEKRPEGLSTYRITLPVHGAYPDIRNFIGSTLQQMPHAALDAVRFERKRRGDNQLDAQVRFTLYLRTDSQSETR